MLCFYKNPVLILVIGIVSISSTIYTISENDKMQQILQIFQVKNEKELIDKAELLQEIQKVFQVDSAQEAIGAFLAIEDNVNKQTLTIYQTIANALNSKALQKMIDENKDTIADPETIKELNHVVYDTIFELKKLYYESTMLLNSYAEPLIQQFDEIIQAVQKKASYEEIIPLIPVKLPEKPTLESIPKEELINTVKKLEIN